MKQNIYREFGKMNSESLCVLSQMTLQSGRGYGKAFPVFVAIAMSCGETGELDATAGSLAEIVGVSASDISHATKRLVEWGFIEYRIRRTNSRGNLYRINPQVFVTVSEYEYEKRQFRDVETGEYKESYVKVTKEEYKALFKKYNGLPLRTTESKPFIKRIKEMVTQIFTTL